MKRFPAIASIFTFAILLLVSCGGTGGGGVTPTPTPTVSPTPTPQPTVTPEPFIGDDEHMCNTGETVVLPFLIDGTARFTLNDGECPGKDNTLEEYSLILYNTTYANIGFSIDSPAEVDPFTKILAKEFPTINTPQLVNDVDQQSHAYYQTLKNDESSALPTIKTKTNDITADFAVGEEMEYRVRCDYDDPNVFCTESAILQGTGAHINVFVDRNVPYNDAAVDPVYLDSTDVQRIVDVYEENIYPLQSTLLGQNCTEFSDSNCPLSDIDSDGKVSVIITPVLNWLPLTASDSSNAPMPAVYVDTRNLQPFNDISNAGSNEQEVIFLYAPDEESHFNYKESVDKSFWASKGVFAWLSVGLEKLISYNFHVFLYGASPENDWVDFGLGGLLADISGFNIWVAGVWRWLDAPAYGELLTSSEYGCSLAMAGPYLFFLYMMDSQVDDVINETINDGKGNLLDSDLAFIGNFMSELTGTDNIENAIDVPFNEDAETEFSALFRNWTVALLTSGTDRDDLQVSTDFQYYFVRTDDTGTLPDSRLLGSGIATLQTIPVVGDEVASTRYGADGTASDFNSTPNPVGIDLNNFNYLDDAENPTWAALIENPHEFTHVPGNKFYGVVEPFTANFVRLGGLFESETDLVVNATSPNLQAFVVKRSDLPTDAFDGRTVHPRVYSESIFGSLDQKPENLDTGGPNSNTHPDVKIDHGYYAQRTDIGNPVALNEIGTTMTIVGRIDPPDKVTVWDDECNDSDREVYDFDKYQIRIPDGGDGALGDEGNLALWIDRQADSTSGKSSFQPMLAVVSWDDVPYPSGRYTDSTNPSDPKINPREQYRWIAVRSTEDGVSYLENGAASLGRTGDNPECDDFLATWPGTDLESPSRIPYFEASDDFNPGYTGCAAFWEDWGNTVSWVITGLPDKLYAREILIPTPDDPFIASGPDQRHFDPRSYNSINLDCRPTALYDPEERDPFDPDDLLSASELRTPTSFQEQILVEMSRDSVSNTDANLTIDTLTVDLDSKDDDSEGKYTGFDMGNNVGGRSVVNDENSMILACTEPICDTRLEHIWLQHHASDDPTQDVYNFDTATDTPYLELLPGYTYVIIVGGVNGDSGNYELKLRKIVPANSLRGTMEVDSNG